MAVECECRGVGVGEGWQRSGSRRRVAEEWD